MLEKMTFGEDITEKPVVTTTESTSAPKRKASKPGEKSAGKTSAKKSTDKSTDSVSEVAKSAEEKPALPRDKDVALDSFILYGDPEKLCAIEGRAYEVAKSRVGEVSSARSRLADVPWSKEQSPDTFAMHASLIVKESADKFHSISRNALITTKYARANHSYIENMKKLARLLSDTEDEEETPAALVVQIEEILSLPVFFDGMKTWRPAVKSYEVLWQQFIRNWRIEGTLKTYIEGCKLARSVLASKVLDESCSIYEALVVIEDINEKNAS